MIRFLLKRLLELVPVLLIMSFVVFMIIHLIPGDPARVILGEEATQVAVEALRERMGLNDPLLLQYFRWLKHILTGDFGQSVFMKGSIPEIILDHIIPTVQLATYTMLIALAVALPLGILAAQNRYTALDNFISGCSMLGISLPSFLLALLLMLVFAVQLRLLPPAGYKPIEDYGFWANLRYMCLPALSMGLVEAGLLIRMTRSSLLDVMDADYIKMARANGVGELSIILRHALKNAALPILTAVGQTFVAVVSSALVAETIFNIPGIGQLIVNSVSRRDYEVIQAIVLLIAVLNVVTYLLVDICYRFIDPRIKLGK